MNFIMRLARLVAFCLAPLPLCALAHQDPVPVKAALEEFLRVQTRGLPGAVSFQVNGIDPANNLPPCEAFDPFLPSGARLWGRTTIGVRCVAGASWSLFIKVQVRVEGDYLVASHALAQGQVLVATDLARQHGDLTDLPGGVITESEQAIGRTVTLGLAAGRPVRSDMLRQVPAVLQGQSVKIISGGKNFQVSSEGKALNAASAGQVVQVRLPSGQVLSGIARSGGVVEITY